MWSHQRSLESSQMPKYCRLEMHSKSTPSKRSSGRNLRWRRLITRNLHLARLKIIFQCWAQARTSSTNALQHALPDSPFPRVHQITISLTKAWTEVWAMRAWRRSYMKTKRGLGREGSPGARPPSGARKWRRCPHKGKPADLGGKHRSSPPVPKGY